MSQHKKFNLALAIFCGALFCTPAYAAEQAEMQTPSTVIASPAQTESLYASEEEINAAVERIDVVDPRVIYFSTIGSTYMVDFQPSNGSATIVYCNTCDRQYKKKQSNIWTPVNIRPISKPGDLLSLTPVRQTIKFTLPEPSVIDKSFTTEGSPYIEAGLVKIFKAMSIYPDEGYNGTILIDQYRAGLPFKFSFKNVEELRMLIAYFVEHLTLPDGTFELPATKQRSIAMIDCKGIENLNKTEIQILKQFFIIPNQKNEVAKNFFGNVGYTYSTIVSAKIDSYKKEEIGETILRKIKDTATLDGKKLLVATVGIIVGTYIVKNLTSTLDKWDTYSGFGWLFGFANPPQKPDSAKPVYVVDNPSKAKSS